jgi:hypothetical protein
MNEYNVYSEKTMDLVHKLRYIQDLNADRTRALKDGNSQTVQKMTDELTNTITTLDFDNLTKILLNTI